MLVVVVLVVAVLVGSQHRGSPAVTIVSSGSRAEHMAREVPQGNPLSSHGLSDLQSTPRGEKDHESKERAPCHLVILVNHVPKSKRTVDPDNR